MDKKFNGSIASMYITYDFGLEIFDVVYEGMDCKVICKFTNEKKYHKVKIYYNENSEYFRLYGHRYRLNEFIRNNF